MEIIKTVRAKSGKVYTYTIKEEDRVCKTGKIYVRNRAVKRCTPDILTPYAIQLVHSMERAKFDGANDHKELIRIAGATRR